ncbi:MAG: HEAT repeat domain-containing protein [Deltaproteobacteria bacterium]|nr:HEAT repeat domain-containing protein [Deltaproteobacteria bacterium]
MELLLGPCRPRRRGRAPGGGPEEHAVSTNEADPGRGPTVDEVLPKRCAKAEGRRSHTGASCEGEWPTYRRSRLAGSAAAASLGEAIPISLLGILLAVAVAAGCGTTVDDVHRWGRRGQYEQIRQVLSGQPPEPVRVAAAVEFGAGHCPFAIPDLVMLSRDPSPRVRLAAVEALGRYAGREVYTAILGRCGDENQAVSDAAGRILRTWGDESVDVLIEALADRNYRVRVAAVQVLGSMRDARIGHVLVERARRDDNSLVRREAVRSLADSGFSLARPVLYELSQCDPAPEVALEAERALARLGGFVFPCKLVVMPAVAGAKDLGEIAGLLSRRIEEGFVGRRLCEVLAVQSGGKAGKDAAAATLFGRAHQADQVVWGQVDSREGQLRIQLFRLDVASGRLLQQESCEGYEEEGENAVGTAVEQMLSRFR